MDMSDAIDYVSNTGIFGEQEFSETISLSGRFRIPTGANPLFYDQMENNGGAGLFSLQAYIFPSNSANTYQGPPVSYGAASWNQYLTGSYYSVEWLVTGIAVPAWEEDTAILLSMINAI
jgi:hypothetical protein